MWRATDPQGADVVLAFRGGPAEGTYAQVRRGGGDQVREFGHWAARRASSARRSWYGVHCRSEARPRAAVSAKRRQGSNPHALQSHGRPFGAGPIASRIEATASGSGFGWCSRISNVAPPLATTAVSTTG